MTPFAHRLSRRGTLEPSLPMSDPNTKTRTVLELDLVAYSTITAKLSAAEQTRISEALSILTEAARQMDQQKTD